jgi:thiol-disulfide isomerase/thioredoxin
MGFKVNAIVSNYFKKKKPLSIFLDLVFIVLLALLIYPGTRKDVAAFFIRLTSLPPSALDNDEQFAIDNKTKQWQLYDYSLHPIHFYELNEEKPVFLNVWATWCPPCIAEMPGIMRLYKEFNDKINFVLISNESPDKIKAYVMKNKYDSSPFYFYQQLPILLETESIPTTYVIDKKGNVILVKKGAARWNSGRMRNILLRLSEQ